MSAKTKQKKQSIFTRKLSTSYLEFLRQQEFGDHPLKNLVLQINALYPAQ